MPNFIRPDFTQRQLELRFEKNEVCIYGTKEGLNRLIEMLKNLIDNPNEGHIHLDEYQILTVNSLPGVIAVF